MLKKNDLLTLTVTDLTNEGMGVAKHDGYVLFIPKTAVGDVIEARVVKALSSHGFAKCEKIIAPSETRTETDCPVFSKCGGCLFRHIRYDAELAIKKSWVDEHFHRIGKLDISCDTIIPSPSENEYRNKAQIPCAADKDGKPAFGFFAPHSHRIIPCDNCKLQPAFYTEITKTVENWMKECKIEPYNEETHSGILRHLFIRDGRVSGEVMVCLVANSKKLPHADLLVKKLLKTNPKIASIILNVNQKRGNEILGLNCVTLYGKPAIRDTLCGVSFEISPLSFYQVNHDGAEVLYKTAAEFAELSEGDILLDLYCGVGTIGLSMARKAGKLIGVEVIPAAVENAKENAKRNGIENAEFICADAGEAATKLANANMKPDVVIVDPPRKGCGEDVISAMKKLSPKRIVMVSCNSATAARDCARLKEIGYTPTKMRAVDMFPRTGHVETVCLLSKLNAKQHIEINLDMDELDLTDAEKKATYQEIKDYV
ncbi:MAG: 23S rRNA (uracil(1939)-C(5))-methyltransferase RlmD, partial [Ruminococcaceae bacterium]|nr:23S rRNA (uracil(1939)-C(5))-methyltransferase RlmD [Oscillospiraceae bacterium]